MADETDPMQVIRIMNIGLERKDMMVVQMDAVSNWDHFLCPAPASIAILGQLMAIATTKDFSLETKTPVGGFKHLRYPGSFRACLVQISNSGCQAFMTAHKNMDKIRMYAKEFQENIKQIIGILLKGTEEEKVKVLPGMLEDLKDDAKICLTLADETEKRFNNVVLLVDETSEASAAVKGVYEENLKETRNKMDQLQIEEQKIEKEKRKMEEKKERAIDKMKSATIKLEKSVDKVPGIATLLLSQTVEETLKMASGAMNLFAQYKMTSVTGGLSLLTGLFSGNSSAMSSNTQDTPHDRKQEMQVAFQHSSNIHTCIEEIYKMFVEKEDTKGTTEVTVDLKEHKKTLEEIKDTLEDFKEEYKKSEYAKDNDVTTIKDICKRAIGICDEILKTPKKKNLDDLLKKTVDLKDESKGFQLRARQFFSQSPFASTCITKSEKQKPKGKGAAEIASENARYEVEMRKKELDYARERHEKMKKEAREVEEKQFRVLKELSKTNISTINFETIQETLNQGIIALSDLKKQWSLLVVFFSNVTNGIDICLSQKTYKIDKRLKGADYTLGEVTRDFVLEMAASVNAVAYSVQLIAQAYTDISKKHLIQNTASLGELIAFDPNADQEELRKRRDQLMTECERAQKEIRKLSEESRVKLEHKILEMKQRLKTEVEDKLPPIAQAKLKVIQENVKKCDMTEDDYV